MWIQMPEEILDDVESIRATIKSVENMLEYYKRKERELRFEAMRQISNQILEEEGEDEENAKPSERETSPGGRYAVDYKRRKVQYIPDPTYSTEVAKAEDQDFSAEDFDDIDY